MGKRLLAFWDKCKQVIVNTCKQIATDKRKLLIASCAALLVVAVVVGICVAAGGNATTPPQNEGQGNSIQGPQGDQGNQGSQGNQGNQGNQGDQGNQDAGPALNYCNPLTGEPVAEPFKERPVAVMLNNIKAAMPQHGVSQADILYEVLAEGGITRCMGIFTDMASVEKVGAIRSARLYYVQLAQGYGAAYVHAGSSSEAKKYLKALKNTDLDAGLSATYFYRDQDRLNAGYSLEHTLFSSGEKILTFAQKRGVTTSLDEEKTYGMSFDDEKVTTGQAAKEITVYFNQGGNPTAWTKSTKLTYNESTKTYFAYQHGGDYIDGNTKETVAFRNILVLKMKTVDQNDKSHHLTITSVGSGEGYFACNGQIVPIKWSREDANAPFTYTLENGDPVTFGVGSTYIGVIPTDASVSYQ